MKIHSTIAIAALVIFSGACGPTTDPGVESAPETALKFSDGTAASGVKFDHAGGKSKEKWMPEVLGGGVAIADFDRDGDPDLLLVNSGDIAAEVRPENAGNRLYINDGKGKFTDATSEWKLPSKGYGQGAAVGDFNNDGFTDVYLTELGGDNRLLKNTGTGFEDVTDSSGLKNDGKWSTSAGFADFDNDGDLDLFEVRYVEYSRELHVPTFNNGIPTYSNPVMYGGVSDRLFINDGNGKFTDASESSGIGSAAQKGLALAIGDIDKDGDQDIYTANDTTPNQLWINDGKGVFEDTARLSGCAYSETGNEEGSMGADFTDVDGNGFLDIAVTNFQEESTALYSQEKAMLFREVSDAVGIGASARQRLKFGIDFFDADNDGDEDLVVANGHIEDNIEKNSSTITFAQPNSIYENLGDGQFLDVTVSAGQAFTDKQVSRGLATADLDGDGDLDMVIVNNGGTAQIVINESSNKGGFVVILLEGSETNRNAIGARLIATIGEKTVERQVMGAQSYLSVSDFRVHFGLGGAEKIDKLEIRWPGGESQELSNVAGGKFYFVKEGSQPLAFVPGQLKR